MFVISVPQAPASMRQQVKSLLRERGWISTPKNEPSFFENLDVEDKVTDRYRPIEDKDVPDADVVVATWWETAELVLSIYTKFLQQRGHKILIVSTPPRQPTLIEQLKSLLRGKGWLPTPKKELSHFDTVNVDRPRCRN